jgi:integrative and conjugative element protein (TIGR02256 family)
MPHPNCPICQKLEDIKVKIIRDAYEFMKKESSGSNDIETGGVLIGHRTSGGQYIISRASGPGPNAVRTKMLFEKDTEYCQKELEKAFEELKDKGLYLGEWHYHPIGSNKPSGLDIKSLTAIALQDNYRIDKPVMIIFSPSLECAITIHDKNRHCVQLPIEICRTSGK